MMKLSFLGSTLVLLIAIVPVAYSANNPESQAFSNSGIVQYKPDLQHLDVAVLRHFIEYGTFSAEQEASACDIWSGHYDVLPRAVELHALNPKIKCLLYRNIRTVWGPNHRWEYDSAQLQLFTNNGWILKDAEGNLVVEEGGYGYLVDVGNPEYQSWLAQWLKGYVTQYEANGVFLDNCLASNEIIWGTTQVPINPRTGLAWTNQEWHYAVVSLVNTVKTVLGDAIYVVGNGVWNGANWNNRLQYYKNLLLNSNIDGIMSEGWISNYNEPKCYDETTWKKSIDMAIWINDNFLTQENKLFIALSYNAQEGTLPNGIDAQQYALFSYASLLLAASNKGNSLSFGSYLMTDYTQSLFEIKVGQPTSTYTIIPNSHVYMRNFTNAKVLVNPTDTVYTINLNGEYLLDAALVSTLTVQPYSGIILKTV
jgi:hypothetical protein